MPSALLFIYAGSGERAVLLDITRIIKSGDRVTVDPAQGLVVVRR